MLLPPSLPQFLSVMFDLKAIEGVPSDEDAKLVHATIRALNEVTHMPGLYDSDLAMSLSEYLFSIQMERYRDKYPCIIFPSDTTYRPPELPAHIPVALNPVTNSASDDQIKSVQTALRMSENLANVPSMFDADLSMNLSQHLFDIQFGRYLWRMANRVHEASSTDMPQLSRPAIREPQDNQSEIHQHSTDNAQNQGHHDAVPRSQTPLSAVEPLPEVTSLRLEIESLQSEISTLKTSVEEAHQSTTKLEDTKELLAGIHGELSDVKKTLVGMQNCTARGINSAPRYSHYIDYYYSLVNAKGETPESNGLPSTKSLLLDSPNDLIVARYLRFYGIGEDLIQEGDELTIKEGSSNQARAALMSHVGR